MAEKDQHSNDPYTNPGGWGKPALSTKWHWFHQGMSICGRWCFNGHNDDRDGAGSDCCKACAKKLTRKTEGAKHD